MTEPITFDPIWRKIYDEGHTQSYPWDVVVSFVFRHAPRDLPAEKIQILEVGCGTASNLWFAAREGFSVTGVDASETAIEVARCNFERDGLVGTFKVADFTELPLKNSMYDLAIDRAAITNCGRSTGARAINEIQRVLKPGGFFLFNPYADGHSSQSTGHPGPDGVVTGISGGTLTGVGQIYFYSRNDVRAAFSDGWKLTSMRHLVMVDELMDTDQLHSEWRVIAQKV